MDPSVVLVYTIKVLVRERPRVAPGVRPRVSLSLNPNLSLSLSFSLNLTYYVLSLSLLLELIHPP